MWNTKPNKVVETETEEEKKKKTSIASGTRCPCRTDRLKFPSQAKIL
jgi:hypothetical protein